MTTHPRSALINLESHVFEFYLSIYFFLIQSFGLQGFDSLINKTHVCQIKYVGLHHSKSKLEVYIIIVVVVVLKIAISTCMAVSEKNSTNTSLHHYCHFLPSHCNHLLLEKRTEHDLMDNGVIQVFTGIIFIIIIIVHHLRCKGFFFFFINKTV